MFSGLVAERGGRRGKEEVAQEEGERLVGREVKERGRW